MIRIGYLGVGARHIRRGWPALEVVLLGLLQQGDLLIDPRRM
jgi:hypothetical protein